MVRGRESVCERESLSSAGTELQRLVMWGALNSNRPLAMMASVRPAVRWSGIGVVAAGALIAAFALPKSQPMALPVTLDEVVLTADNALSAAIRTGNRGVARRLLTLQFTYVDADGKIHPRREFLGDLKNIAARPTTNIKVRNFGSLAMMTGKHTSAQGADVLFLDIWVKQKGAWRALLMQDMRAGTADNPDAALHPIQIADMGAHPCNNPCNTMPYRVRSAAEQDVAKTYQAITKAIAAGDAGAWAKNVADEFVAYASSRAPLARSSRIAAIEDPNDDGAARIGEVQNMRLAVYGDGAVMTATEASGPQPAYRAARVFVKRDGRWLMAATAQTDVKSR
jgi:hypothetical protein